MKIAIEYSGHLRFIKETFPKLKDIFVSRENIEFYVFVHTWDCSRQDDIQYMKNIIKPHRYFIEKQKHFERHPYQLINFDLTHEEYKNDVQRLKWNEDNPNDIKEFHDKPSADNNFKFDKDVQVVKFDYYSSWPFNNLSMFYSIHQVGLLRKSYAQEFNIEYDYVVRLRSDVNFTNMIDVDNHIDKDKINVFDSAPHNGYFGKYTIQDQFAIAKPDLMNIYDDVFVYLPCYYVNFKIDWITEILLGFHLMYNEVPIKKLPRTFHVLYYSRNLSRTLE